MDNLFVYGTFLCEDIFLAVAGCRRHGTECILKGYRRLPVRGEPYPGITPAPGGRVRGLLYHDIPRTVWFRLDRFEGDMFRRQPVTVSCREGTSRRALVYVVRTEFVHLLEPGEWDLNRFLSAGKNTYLESYRGFTGL